MVLTRHFKETVANRIQKDAQFRSALLTESVETFLSGNINTGKSMLRDYINSTIGFELLSKKLNKDSKSIHRMLGPGGNPRAENIFNIFKILQDAENISLHVIADKNKAA